MQIGNYPVGGAQAALLVAEIAQAHEGSYPMAHAMIVAAKEAKADAVKFQCHIAKAESYVGEPWRVEPKWQPQAGRYAYWERMQFAPWQWDELQKHASSLGLAFIVSPFSVAAVDLLSENGIKVDAWKVPSGEIVQTPGGIMLPGLHNPLLPKLSATGKPVIISTGMSTLNEILDVFPCLFPAAQREDVVTPAGLYIPAPQPDYPHVSEVAFLHCTSEYPTPAHHTGLNLFTELRDRFTCPVGISDHSGTIWPAISAATLGADIIEVHVTFDKNMPCPDSSSSITFAEFRQMVDGVRFVEAALTDIDRDDRAEDLAPMRELFGGRWKRVAQ